MQQNYDPPVGLNHQKPDITSGKTTRSAYRYDINGLRAVAVIAVIVNHFNRDILPLGYLGVDLFFLISGFVITSSISGKKSSIGIAKFWTDFYVRRFKRLYPALAACILVTSILICCFDPYPIASLRTGFAAIFGVSNLYLFKQATDYFGAWAELNVFTHTWSLGVEEQFYLIFPLVVYATSLRRDAEVFPKLFFWVVALASAASLAFYVFISATNESLAFFTLPARLWELGCGSLLFFVVRNDCLASRVMQAIPSLLLLLLMIVLLCMTGVGETAATLGVIIISTLLIGSLGPTGFAYRLLTLPVMAYLGRISYSLYLWHWSVICLSRWTIGLSWWLAPALLVVTLALATASYHLIEAKLRHAPWSDKRWKSLVIGLSSLAGLAFVMVVLLGPGHKALYLGSPPPSDEQANANRATGGNRGTVLMIGDSHAGEFGVLVSNLARQFDMRPQVVSFGATAYPTVRISTPVGGLTLARSQLMSAQADAQVDRALTGMNPNGKNLIILSSFYSFYFGSLPGIRSHQVMTHYDASHRLISREKALDAWLGNLRAFAIHHSNQPIVIFLSTPQMPNIYSQNICRKEWFRPNPSANCRITVDRQRTVALLAELNARIAGAVADLPGVSLFDPLPALCPAQDRVCRSDDGDIRLFSDEDHLTLAGVEKVQAAFAHFLLEHKLLL